MSVDPAATATTTAGPEGGPPDIRSLGRLRASGHVHRHLREEIRDNLLRALREGFLVSCDIKTDISAVGYYYIK